MKKFVKIVAREIHAKKLGHHKICTRWVPKILIEYCKEQRLAESLTFLEAYVKHSNELLGGIVTGDKTWATYIDCKIKR